MGCWVVPSIAAEFWRVSLDHVMDGIRTGTIQSKNEDGFLLVEAIPDSPTMSKSDRNARKPTFVEVVEDVKAVEEQVEDRDISEDSHDSDDSLDGDGSGDAETFDIHAWREKRQQAGTIRKAPGSR